MKKIVGNFLGFLSVSFLVLQSCQHKKEDATETIIKGKATVYVDESILPIVEDEEAVFETQYEAKLHLVPQSESEIINSLFKDTAKIAILTKTLSDKEIKAFQAKKIFPKITPFATDAVALIRNKTSNDTLIALQDVIDFIQGKSVPEIKGLVFDNANSSTVRYMNEVAGASVFNQKNVFSFKTNQEVIKYVAENNGMIGVVGINWILQPPLELQSAIDKIQVLSVKDKSADTYVFPSQDNLAQGKYPLARHLYIVNCQGYTGLGMGFASFVAGERGQRIILKSGLVPERFPTRKVLIRNSITTDKK